MKRKSLLFSLVLLAVSLTFVLKDGLSQIPQTMSYQGVLATPDGTPVADGKYSLTFRLYTVGTGGPAIWQETHSSVTVIDGLFNVFLGSVEVLTPSFDKQYWLGISVDGGAELEPRVQLASSPYSLNAQSVANNAITGSKIADGYVVRSINGKTDNVTLAKGANVTITPSGNTLTISSSFDGWKLTGNAGTTAGTHFLGTTDDQALELRVNNLRTLRLESGTDSYSHDTANVVAGYSGNYVEAGVWGATIAGGGNSYVSGDVIGANRVTARYGSIGGGSTNNTSGNYSTIGGGGRNAASDSFSTIGGGYENNASEYAATISGGTDNTASGNTSTISGGFNNTTSGLFSTVGGGSGNTASGDDSTVGGGFGNHAVAKYATIAGGGRDDSSDPDTGNRVTDDYGTIGGGGNNQAGDGVGDTDNSRYATVGGGRSNTASGTCSTISGGCGNAASASYATVSGGSNNTASGLYSAIPGGVGNEANGSHSFAVGHNAKANHNGCFVWGDSTWADIASSRADQFTIRAKGGTRIFCSGDYNALYVKADDMGNVAYLMQDNAGNSAKTLYAENKGLGRVGHFRNTNPSSTSDAVAASTQGSGNALVGYTSGSGWAGYFQGVGASSKGVYVSTGSGSQGLQVVGGSKSAVVKTSQGARALYSEEATEVWFIDYGFGRLENGRVAIRIDPLYMETVNLEEPYHVFIQVNDPDCQGVAVTNRTPAGFEVVELRNGRSDAEFSYRIVAKRRGFEDERLEHREMADDDPNLVYAGD